MDLYATYTEAEIESAAIVSRIFRKFILLPDKISQPAMLSESVTRSISER